MKMFVGRGWMLPCLFTAGAAVLGLSGRARADDPPLSFIFDNGFHGSACLNFQFSRPCSTVGTDGAPLDPDEPRAGRADTIAGAPVFEMVRKVGGLVDVMGSGVDLDGVTPVLVVYDTVSGNLDVFTVSDGELIKAEKTGVGRHRTSLDPDAPDMLHGAVPGKRYSPEAVVVCHGAILLFSTVRALSLGGGWGDTAAAFFSSVDDGDTWELIYEDTPVQPGLTRGREWSIQNWWPVAQGPAPTEAFITATDYRANPGSSGGRMYMLRLTRPDSASPWTIERPKLIYDEEGVYGEHFHTAALVPMPGGGLRALIAVGDSQPINRIISLTRPDHDWSAPDWKIGQEYHGSMGSPGTEADQFCGSAPGTRLGDVLAGSDLDDEQLMLIKADGPADHPATSWLYGRSWVDGRRSANFVIRTPFPERGTGPYISKYDPWHADSDQLIAPRRGLYSADGAHWAQAFSPGSKGVWTIGLHGGHIYFSRSAAADMGLIRTPVPAMVTVRPLLVGPGGVQRLVPHPVVSGVPGAITALVRSPEGLWMDAGVALDPQPPCAGPVYRCHASKTDASSRIGEFKLTSGAADVGNVLGTDALQFRCWVRNMLDRMTVHPNFLLAEGGNQTSVSQSTSLSVTDAWMSVDVIGDVAIDPGQSAQVDVRSGGAKADDADFYLAIEAIAEGDGFQGFAKPLDETAPPQGTVFPDELASVGGFACGPKWTATLAGLLPQDGWDQSISQIKEWPLCTLWGDSKNYVSLVADTAAGQLVARIVRNGAVAARLTSTTLYWLRGSSVLVSLADDGAGVRMTLSAAGLELQEAQADHAASPAVAPTSILFGEATGKSGDGAVLRVSPMEWFGGRIDPAAALDSPSRRALLTSLSFLTQPLTRSADLDGDGQNTIFDFFMFVNLFVAADSKADFDGNGGLDLFDFLAFQNEFAIPCG